MANYTIPPYNKGTRAVFDFSGGLNNTNPKHLIEQNELTDTKNIIIDGTAIEKRKGTELYGQALGTDTKIYGLGHYKEGHDTNASLADHLLTFYNTKLYIYDTITADDWGEVYGDFSNDASRNMDFTDFIGRVFMATGRSLHSYYTVNGDPPLYQDDATADNTTNTLTFVDNDTMYENDTVRLDANTMPTGLSSSTTYYAVNVSGKDFQVSTSVGGAVETFSDDGSGVVVTVYARVDLDIPVSGGDTADKPYYIATFKERLIMANTVNHKRRVYYSDEGAATISTNNYFDVHGEVTALHVYKNHLFVFTEDEIYRIDGFVFSGAGTEPERLNPLKQGTGCVSHRSIKVCNGMMYFLGREDVYACDGTRVYPIARPKIRETFDGLYQNYFEDACAGVLKHRYYLAVKSEGADKNDTILVFDTRNKCWTYFDSLNPSCFAEYPNEAGEYELMYGDDNDAIGKVWKMNQGFADGAPNEEISNGSMESGSLGSVPTDWAENYNGTTTGSVEKSASAAILGSHSAELIRTGGDSYMDAHQDCTVTASTTYQWQAWIKTAYQGNDEDIYMHIIKSTSPYTVYATFQIGSKDNLAGRYYYGTVDVPAGITGVSVGLVLNTNMDTTPVYLDDVRFREEGSAITANVETGVLHFGTPYRNKKFKKTFISAKSSDDYDLDDTDYNLTFGHASGFNDSFTTTTIDLDDDTDKVEEYVRTSLKSKHIRYKFYNSGKNQPFKIYGLTSVYIPLQSLR